MAMREGRDCQLLLLSSYPESGLLPLAMAIVTAPTLSSLPAYLMSSKREI